MRGSRSLGRVMYSFWVGMDLYDVIDIFENFSLRWFI